MHIDLVNPTLNATRFANAHTQIMCLQMQKKYAYIKMHNHACGHYLLQCISQVDLPT